MGFNDGNLQRSKFNSTFLAVFSCDGLTLKITRERFLEPITEFR
jgi:hypothetical protein